ncbi:MAG TPA: hypothetical protein DHW47_06985 [Oscillibacter sp.]|nr:hypothetical protein [Oscillibacter sp.]
MALVLTLTLTLAQADVRVELDGIDGGSASVTASEDDSAALLEGYLYQLNGLDVPEVVKEESSGNTASRPATYAVALNNATKTIYDKLVPEIKAIANGERTSSIVKVEGLDITYYKSDLGLDTLVTGNSFTAEAQAKVKEMFTADVSADVLLTSLITHLPYELYWFDKVKGIQISYEMTGTDEYVTISSVEIMFHVSQDYAVTEGNSYYPTMPDTTKTGAATAAAAKAAEVVAENQGKGTYGKLVAYREYITNAVDYNFDVANTANYPYGDPWQLIYVFDNDPDTNVVCEGYSKAFKYLCDLTWTGSDPEVKCYLAVGKMDSEDHMWNIVSIGGVNYLTDITNCDSYADGKFAIGYPDQMFLCGAEGGVDAGYTVDIPGQRKVLYTYDDKETKRIYNDQELVLSDTRYSPLTFDLNQLIALARYAAGITTDDSAAIDVNNDGIISAADLTAMAQSLVS